MISLGQLRRPHGIAVLPATGEIVVTIENPFGLVKADPVARKVVRQYSVNGDSPHMVTLGSGGETAWVSNSGSGTVSLVSLRSGAVEAAIPTGQNPQGSTLSADGTCLYVTNMGSNTISAIDTKTRRVVGQIQTGTGPARVFISPDGKTLFTISRPVRRSGSQTLRWARRRRTFRFPGSPFRFRCRATDERHTSEFRTVIKWRSFRCRNAGSFVCSIRRVAQDRIPWSHCEGCGERKKRGR